MNFVKLGRPLAVLKQLGEGFQETAVGDQKVVRVLNLNIVVLMDVCLVVELDVALTHEFDAEHRGAVPLRRRLLQNLHNQNLFGLPIASDVLCGFIKHDFDRHVLLVQKGVRFVLGLVVDTRGIKTLYLLEFDFTQFVHVEV